MKILCILLNSVNHFYHPLELIFFSSNLKSKHTLLYIKFISRLLSFFRFYEYVSDYEFLKYFLIKKNYKSNYYTSVPIPRTACCFKLKLKTFRNFISLLLLYEINI